ncbi:MAG: DUF5110 domain-containing protein [Anaerolineae bacterium]|nr:DUF5110 domain-containing protein [Anaerolineae bacterium]
MTNDALGLRRIVRVLLLVLLVGLTGTHLRAQPAPGVFRTTIAADGLYITLELLDDDLAHFELGTTQPAGDAPIWTSPMVAKTDYPGPTAVDQPGDGIFSTPELRVEIDPISLCTTLTDLTRDPALTLTTLCPSLNDGAIGGLSFTQAGTTDVYGLGEQFQNRRGPNGNWIGRERTSANAYGNGLVPFNGGNVGNAQFPILYALGQGMDNYALFLDHVYAQQWSFARDPFTVQTTNAPLRWYVMSGPSLADLRGDYLELSGRPPVPPKQMFGLWVSEYGYEDWGELTGVLDSLRAAHFPVDGFALDLQWFGGISPTVQSQMGSLTWDEGHFPDPAGFIADLRAQGIGVMPIEEPYVSSAAQGYDEDLAQGVLARECGEVTCAPVALSAWWGSGSLIDWSDPAEAAWWHDARRQPLVDAGVTAHWTDLGEPEIYDEEGWYYGLPEFDRHDQATIHNLYNLLWSASIWDGYQRSGVERRPFILSRSGTSGSQRYGVAMWSGDIGANMRSLAAHLNVQMQMSLSGVDYFGADVGGFLRQAADPAFDMNEMYTVWLANAALLDVPLRPHTFNVQNVYQTAPSLIGDVASNLANVRLRYALGPYLYTLAHLAYREGTPLFAPLVYYYQDDPEVRALANQKMIGPDMMMAALSDYDLEHVSVYLPAGGWFDYHTHAYYESAGEWITVPGVVDGITRAPLFVRDGALIPQMAVDDGTANMLGQRLDGGHDERLIVSAYHAESEGAFTLIEDDGETMAYQDGDVHETRLSQHADDGSWQIAIDGITSGREVELHLIGQGDSEIVVKGVADAGGALVFRFDTSTDE